MTDRTVVYRLRADAQQFSAQMKAAGASVGDAANKMTAANKEGSKFRQGLDTLGSTAGKIGLVAAAGLGAAVVKAANFDQAMSNVQAATHETARNMDLLREAALEAGAQTAFSASEAADGIEQLAKAGVTTESILNGGLRGALDLAAAGQMEVGAAAEAAAGAMAQFGLEGSQVPHIADLLAAAAGKAQGDVSDMVMALKQGGTVAAQTGLSLEETTGALAAMAEQSLLGSDAGTSFKTMLASLTPNSEKAAEAMAAYNINAYDAQGNFIGMTALAGQLRDGLGELTDEQRAMALETIFGSDAVRAASIIYDNGAEGIAKWISQTNDAGFAAETASTRLDNLRGDLEELGGSIETALIGSGDGSQGFLRGLTQSVTGAINVYNDLPPAAQNAASGVLAAGAAIGGSIWVGSKLVQGIANTREAMEQLGVSGPKATKAMKGMAAAAAGLAALTVVAAGIRAIQDATDETLPGLESLESRLISMAELPEGFSGTLGSEFDSLAESIDRMTDKGKLTEWSDAIGGVTSFDSGSLRQARAEIESLDQALAGLVASGNGDVAAEALANIADQYALSESQVDGLLSAMPAYEDALAGQANEAALAANEQQELASAAQAVGSAMGSAAPLTKAQAKALEDARDAARETAQGFFNLGDGLNDAKVSLGDWIKQMADQAAALRNFRKNAEEAANKGLRQGLINALREAGPEGALRMRQLANATDAEIRRANKAWQSGQAEIRKYVGETTKVPKNVSTTVQVDTAAASQRIASINAQLAAIDRNIVVNVGIRGGGGGEAPYLSGGTRRASGGPVYGPGTATSDSIPAYLSNGEYVIKAAAVEKYGVHTFDRLNAMHFAEGGKVERRPVRSGVAFHTEDNTKALQRAIDRLAMVAEDQTAAVEDQTRRTDEWAKRMADVAQATVSGFNTGLFDRDSNVWAAGSGGGPLANLTRDIAGLQERGGLQSQLAGMGLSGDALAALLAQGSNADISALIQSGQATQYAALFNQRAALQGSVGAAAGQQAYGSQFAAEDATRRAMVAELKATQETSAAMERRMSQMQAALERMERNAPERTGAEVGRAINGGAAKAQREKKNRTGVKQR